MKIPDGQKRTIQAIQTLKRASGRNSTLDEIAAHMGVSVSAVRHHLVQLQLKGYLKPRQHQSHRTIELTEEAYAA
jgi:predicted ArsR family transcriptional regulator